MSNEKLIIDFVKSLNFNSSYQCPSAWIGHEKLAHFLIKTCKPKTIVELGVHNGFSYFSFCQTVHDYKLETKCFGIDHWQGDLHAGLYDEKVYEEVLDQNKKYKYFSELIKKDFNSALVNFKDHSIDFLHIDGYHTYDAVKNDFTNWLSKCSKDALILFHDVNEFKDDFGVYKFFNELKESYSHFTSPHAHGLGIITLSKNKDNIINFLNTFDIQTNFSALLLDQHRELLKKKELDKNVKQQSKTIQSLNQTLTTKDQEIHNLNNISNKLYEENIRLDSNINSLNHEYSILFNKIEKSRYQVLNPLYNNIYKISGKILRNFLSNEKVDFLKKLLFKNKYEIRQLGTKNFVTLNVIKNREKSNEEYLLRKGDIFIFSIIDWNFRFQRPQQLALQLSKLKRRVFFIEMTMSDDDNTIVKEISDNLFKVNFSKKKIGFIQPYTEKINHKKIKKFLNEFFYFCESTQSSQFKHFVVQHPFWWQIVKNIPGSQINFDCMDNMKGFNNSTDFIIREEEELVDKCDNLIVSSDFLKDQFSKSKNDISIIRNAANYRDFIEYENNFTLKNLINHKNKIKIGYVGAISDWFDFDLIKDIATKQENFEFHLCGEVTSEEADKITSLKNIHLYGEINYNEIPSFLEKIDITIIPFKIIPLTLACDPVKIYEYSACQKPCVATNLSELFRLKDIVFLASNSNEFINQINNSFNKLKDEIFLEELKNFAKSNSWEDRAKLFANKIDNVPLVSVIILSYGDPNLTINATYSLFHKGLHYPNMEIIIVDNNSKDEDLRKIKEFCKPYKNIKIIENEQNLGFAKGNNIGINQSSGEYILLLNNDTYVAPGAIFSMISKLKNNKKIGVVGPLTNNIGNEAKLDVQYKDMHEMKKIAFDNTIFNRGNYTELNMVAYFAVMFRKIDFEKFGPLSEEYGVGMFEDDDHCAMIKSKGNICVLAEDAFIHHELSASFSKINEKVRKKNFEKNKLIYEKKWGVWIPHQYRTNSSINSLNEYSKIRVTK